MEIDYLNICLSVASEEVGYDLKKKHAPPRWNILEVKQTENAGK
jgi:hypothetical protein